MSRKFIEFFSDFKPFFSILCLVSTLFLIVFLQMEERRHGYALLKLTREHRLILEEKSVKSIQLTKQTRPQQVERLAQSRLTMKRVRADQIIHLTSSEVLASKDKN